MRVGERPDVDAVASAASGQVGLGLLAGHDVVEDGDRGVEILGLGNLVKDRAEHERRAAGDERDRVLLDVVPGGALGCRVANCRRVSKFGRASRGNTEETVPRLFDAR